MGRQGCIAFLALWMMSATGCSLQKGGKGDTCTRSAQCATGLACIRPEGDGTAREGKCSSDLSSLYDPDQIPMLMPDTGVPEVDPGMDATAVADDDAGS